MAVAFDLLRTSAQHQSPPSKLDHFLIGVQVGADEEAKT